METSKKIFSQKFPDARPAAILERVEEQCRAVPDDEKTPVPPFEDMLRRINETYSYEPKPGAEKKAELFISFAMEMCREFEIDTEIIKKEYEIDVMMDLDNGWYGGDIKRSFSALLGLADDFTLTCDKSEPDCVRISMSYHTHNLYSHGKKVDWW